LRLRIENASVEDLIATAHREVAELLKHEQASLLGAQHYSAIAGSTPLFTTLLNTGRQARRPDSTSARAASLCSASRSGPTTRSRSRWKTRGMRFG
jgi:hypothetical protein